MDRGVRNDCRRAAQTEGRLTVSTPGPDGPSGSTTAPAAPPPGPSGPVPSAPAALPSGAEDLRLPKPPGFIRAYFNRHPWLLDGFIAGSYAVPMGSAALFALVGSFFGFSPYDGDPLRGSPVFAVLLFYVTGAVTVGLLFRRHVPVMTAAICAGSLFAMPSAPQQLDAVPMMFALYALAVYRSSRSAWLWTGIAVACAVASMIIDDPSNPVAIVGFAVLFGLLMVVATLVGITFGNRRRYIQALLDRASQLARERDQQARLAAAGERARIAREMHDIVAHSLTVIVALSDGAEASLDRSPEAAREAVTQTGVTARRALADMRRALGVLAEPEEDGATGNSGDSGAAVGAAIGAAGGAGYSAAASPGLAPLAPQPGLDELGELIAATRAAGLPVRYTTSGPPPADPVLQLTVYRVVQEALTNALRYAVQATVVDVVVRFDAEGGITIDVVDDGIDPGRGAESLGSGRGLIGMRERVGVHDGTVSAGPAGPRGWLVHARMEGQR
ncbi:histidine kinase [Herbiconiux solani]|uniref:histidine kinase n=1 Tax=Herbiconiux solani TaxID=661329 RepID=UPI0012ED7396|nr:histidine kinase [Herbiconiux solani]